MDGQKQLDIKDDKLSKQNLNRILNQQKELIEKMKDLQTQCHQERIQIEETNRRIRSWLKRKGLIKPNI